MKKDKELPLLAAYSDEKLCVEAGKQLVEMTTDAAIPAHKGKDLPKADKAALLRKARQPQKA